MARLMAAISAVLVFTVVAQINAQADFDQGVAAYTSGDFEGAVREFTPLADKGDAMSQYHLGLLYEEGQGVPKDYGKASSLYLKSAEGGVPDAMFSLGQLYERGLGVQRDKVAAYLWFDLATRNKHRLGPQELARLGREMSEPELNSAKRRIGERHPVGHH